MRANTYALLTSFTFRAVGNISFPTRANPTTFQLIIASLVLQLFIFSPKLRQFLSLLVLRFKQAFIRVLKSLILVLELRNFLALLFTFLLKLSARLRNFTLLSFLSFPQAFIIGFEFLANFEKLKHHRNLIEIAGFLVPP